MDFFFLILLNAILYIRPAEFIPALSELPLYQIALGICLVFGFPCLLEQLSFRSLSKQPISTCVLLLLVVAVLGQVFRAKWSDAFETLDTFFKVILYYFLLVGVINSSARIRKFLGSMVLCASVISGVAVLDYHGIIHVPSLTVVLDSAVVNGEIVDLRRLGSTGLFGDPNDMCLLLVQNILFAFYLMGRADSWVVVRSTWLAPILLLGHALLLTHSRGGFMSLVVGVAVYSIERYGRNAIFVAVFTLPAVFAIFAGRQTDLSLGGGTAQERIQIWRDYMVLFRSHPLLGIGCMKSLDYIRLVAHNSYLSAYAELGIFGGTAFLGTFLLALWTLKRSGLNHVRIVDPDLAGLRPYLMASVVSYMFGILSLSRYTAVPTYSILGLAAAYGRMAMSSPPLEPLRCSPRLFMVLCLTSGFCLFSFYIFITYSVK